MSGPAIKTHVPESPPFRWEGVPVLAYKEEGTHFRDITRQILFEDESIGAELRYFEIAPGGWSSLERHQHIHGVIIVRGAGRALVGDRIIELEPHDLVRVPPLTWHQFRAAPDECLGFLCLVACSRDRPERPDDAAVNALQANREVREFIRP
jgi:mannose-6-phosphate isomerase-like protein (cupin superfamily)